MAKGKTEVAQTLNNHQELTETWMKWYGYQLVQYAFVLGDVGNSRYKSSPVIRILDGKAFPLLKKKTLDPSS